MLLAMRAAAGRRAKQEKDEARVAAKADERVVAKDAGTVGAIGIETGIAIGSRLGQE
jgi:hypothetical protein